MLFARALKVITASALGLALMVLDYHAVHTLYVHTFPQLQWLDLFS